MRKPIPNTSLITRASASKCQRLLPVLAQTIGWERKASREKRTFPSVPLGRRVTEHTESVWRSKAAMRMLAATWYGSTQATSLSAQKEFIKMASRLLPQKARLPLPRCAFSRETAKLTAKAFQSPFLTFTCSPFHQIIKAKRFIKRVIRMRSSSPTHSPSIPITSWEQARPTATTSTLRKTPSQAVTPTLRWTAPLISSSKRGIPTAFLHHLTCRQSFKTPRNTNFPISFTP